MTKVLIVGGGIAGISSAIQLKMKGFDVTIYEKEKTIGGKMNQIQVKGFTFDIGPTIVMMPQVYQEVFTFANRHFEDYIKMQALDPLYSVYFADGERIKVSTDLVKLTEHLESISYKDTQGYLAYLADIYKRYLVAKDHFIEKSFRKPTDFYNPKTLYNALKLRTFDSAYHSISKYVKDDRLRKLLSFQTLYIGISPYNGPSIYTIIPMIEMVYGVWFMQGGMYAYVKALEKLMHELDIPVYTDTMVDEIIIENKEVKGIMVNQKRIEGDVVLCNADLPYAMKNLISDEKVRSPYTNSKIDNMDYTCSCFMLYLG
ncbi:MAG: phytoene desaturase family protein, partial [Erysipelotrichaceae bacterium]